MTTLKEKYQLEHGRSFLACCFLSGKKEVNLKELSRTHTHTHNLLFYIYIFFTAQRNEFFSCFGTSKLIPSFSVAVPRPSTYAKRQPTQKKKRRGKKKKKEGKEERKDERCHEEEGRGGGGGGEKKKKKKKKSKGKRQ